MAITPQNESLNLKKLPEGSDPRELMIEKLAEQNEILLATIDKAQSLFQETQAKQKEAIENVSKTNDDLREALLKAEAQNNELQLAHQAEIQALHEKYQLQIEEETKEKNDLRKIHQDDKHNLSVYEQGLLLIENIVGPLAAPPHDHKNRYTLLMALVKVDNLFATIRKDLKIFTEQVPHQENS